MKRLIGIAIAMMIAAPTWAAIALSKHDFTDAGNDFTDATADLCSTCHVVHKPLVNVPLWNHAQSTVSFNLYKDNTTPAYIGLDATAYDNTKMGRSAKCLGCHDGTIAVNGVGSLDSTVGGGAYWILCDNEAPAGTAPKLVGAGSLNAALWADGLKGSHPVMVDYDAIRAVDTTKFNIGSGLSFAQLDLDGGTNLVSCTSCHDPHSANDNFLRTPAAGTLCTDCHIK